MSCGPVSRSAFNFSAKCLYSPAMSNRELTYGQVFAALGIGLAVVFSSDRLARLDWLDTALVFLSIGLIAWLSLPSRRLVDPEGHEGARQGIAFLAGKKLNRIWRRLRGRA